MSMGISLRAMAAESKEAIIDIVGVIGWDVAFPVLREMIKSIPETVERVVFDIYSPGGDVWDGNAIVHEIGGMKQETVARVRVAASMATLIAVACKRREMNANGRWLIHNPWTVAMGDAETMEKRAQELREAQDEAAEFYAKRTGQTADAIRALMNDEVWIRADKAKDLGFIHDVIDPFDAAAYAAVREALNAQGKWPRALAEVPDVETEEPAHDDTPDTGAEGDPAVPAPDADDPAVKDAFSAGYEAGRAAGIEEHAGDIEKRDVLMRRMQSEKDKAEAAQLKADAALSDARAEIARIAKDHESAIAAIRGAHAQELTALKAVHQSQMAQMQESLKVATARLSKLLAGSLAFHPELQTWDEALKACGGDYAEARRKHPGLYAEHRKQQKAGRK